MRLLLSQDSKQIIFKTYRNYNITTQTITIDINSQLLANAQSYSKKQGSDLSHFIEMLLYQVVPITDKTKSDTKPIKTIDKLSPFVQSLCGAVKSTKEFDDDIDGDKARLEYLKENI